VTTVNMQLLKSYATTGGAYAHRTTYLGDSNSTSEAGFIVEFAVFNVRRVEFTSPSKDLVGECFVFSSLTIFLRD
jgi:hypothetical protein